MLRKFLILNVFILSFFAFGSQNVFAAELIRCASTTSTQNSGLFDHILPLFKKKTGIQVQVVAVGTGAALRIGKNGDADVVFVHAKEKEEKMVEEGWFVNRKEVMYNHFLIVGPKSDSAQISNSISASKAFKKIADKKHKFISRGDNSGTHTKELKLWELASLSGKKGKWYMETGQGMAKSLRIASNLDAYTLTDEGTFYSLADKNDLNLKKIYSDKNQLKNQYAIMLVNPERHKHVKTKPAMKFINWLISLEGQAALSSYRSKTGRSLFYTD